MLSASCPSCGAPLTFRSADAAAAVCGNCRSVVVQQGLRDVGKVAPFVRDLSPLQVGSLGRYRGQGFRVVGVVRLGRERVRWNEWALRFEDGSAGWLAEGNEVWQVFQPAAEAGRFPTFDRLKVGQTLEALGRTWKIIEVATANISAAEGELPYAPLPGVARPYADLRQSPGRASGTLDYEDAGRPVLWTGEVVDLPDLKMEDLRPFTGWSDPVLTAFAGPELTGTRALQCSGCGAGLTLRAPGQSAVLACEYCGTPNLVDPEGGDSATAAPGARKTERWKPTLALGKRGKFDEIPWEILGALQRSVTVDGARYRWTEYLLHNPYRGYRWLVEDPNGHWSLVNRLPGVPALATHSNAFVWEDDKFRHFQSGPVLTERVLGEFTWEVHAGDRADADDFVSPPRMLSRERSSDEVVWSLGTWLPAEHVAQAFDTDLPAPSGIAPHQPNPWTSPAVLSEGIATAGIGFLLLALLWVAQSVVSAREPLLQRSWTTTVAATDLWLDAEFTVPEAARDNLMVTLESNLDRDAAEAHVALIHSGDSTAYLPSLTGEDNAGSARIASPQPGRYQVRVEVAKDPTQLQAAYGKKLTLSVVRDVPWRTPLVVTGLALLFLPIFLVFASGAFEKRRWENSDHAE